MTRNNFFNKMIFAVAVYTFLGINLHGQDQWLMHVPKIGQSFINPAYQLNNKLEISLPSFSGDFNSFGLNFGQAISKNTLGVNEINLDILASKLKDNHPFNGQIVFNTLDLGLKIKSINLFAGHALVNQNSFILDKDIVNLYLNGNAEYIGKTLDLKLTGATSTYHQFYIGGSTKIGKLSLGTRIKYLNGWYDARCESSKIALTTESDYYQIKLENDIDIKSTGVLLYSGSIKDINLYTDFTSYPEFLTNNSGIGIDLGLTYDVNGKISLMLNALDLGNITWRDKSKRFTNKKTSVLKGINIETIFDGGNGESVSDSLYSAFDLEEVDTEYSNPLNAVFNVGAVYKLNSYTFSGIFSSQNLIDQNKYNASLQASKKINEFLDLGLSYSMKNSSYNNIGLMVNGHIGPVNIFAATQNIISIFNTKEINSLNGRIGISLGFGKIKQSMTSLEEAP